MNWKLEAAYHEAGHALLAYFSEFHIIGGPINLLQYGNGGIFVGLSRSKCVSSGKPSDAAAKRDPDVAKDLALILVGGLAAERLAAELNPFLVPDPSCAEPDHELLVEVLVAAHLSRKFDRFERDARLKLRDNWEKLEALAQVLFRDGGCTPEAAEAILRG